MLFSFLYLFGNRFLSLFIFVFTHELSQHTDIGVLVLDEVEPEHSAKSQLQQVVVKTLFTYANQVGCILKGVPHSLTIAHIDTIIEFTPKRNSFDNESDLALLCPPYFSVT